MLFADAYDDDDGYYKPKNLAAVIYNPITDNEFVYRSIEPTVDNGIDHHGSPRNQCLFAFTHTHTRKKSTKIQCNGMEWKKQF